MLLGQLGVISYASTLRSLLLSLLILRNLFTVATKQFVNKLNFRVVDIQPSIWADTEKKRRIGGVVRTWYNSFNIRLTHALISNQSLSPEMVCECWVRWILSFIFIYLPMYMNILPTIQYQTIWLHITRREFTRHLSVVVGLYFLM